MKKLLYLLPFLILSCTKTEKISTASSGDESVFVNSQQDAIEKKDSLKTGVVALPELPNQKISKTFRVISGDSIIKTINGDMVPVTINDEFTTDRQKFYLNIKNFTGKKIVGNVTSKNSDMNIRFNQIKMPDGKYDGPFGAEISKDIDKPGEIWLIVGKNQMASGNPKGKFSVTLK